MNWKKVSQYKYLSENFMRKYKHKIIWKDISCFQKLSESFMTEFRNMIDWDSASIYQSMSETFLKNNKKFINWNELSYIKHISDPYLSKYVIRTNNWLYISEKSKEIIIRNYYEIVNYNDEKWIKCVKLLDNDFSEMVRSVKVKYDVVGKIYETVCNYNSYNPSGPGFICWSHKEVTKFDPKKRRVTVLLPLKSACMSKNTSIRSNKMMIIDC